MNSLKRLSVAFLGLCLSFSLFAQPQQREFEQTKKRLVKSLEDFQQCIQENIDHSNKFLNSYDFLLKEHQNNVSLGKMARERHNSRGFFGRMRGNIARTWGKELWEDLNLENPEDHKSALRKAEAYEHNSTILEDILEHYKFANNPDDIENNLDYLEKLSLKIESAKTNLNAANSSEILNHSNFLELLSSSTVIELKDLPKRLQPSRVTLLVGHYRDRHYEVVEFNQCQAQITQIKSLQKNYFKLGESLAQDDSINDQTTQELRPQESSSEINSGQSLQR